MNMKPRHEWPVWAATTIALLGLVGLASAQPIAHDAMGALPDQGMIHPGRPITTMHRADPESAATVHPITDDGRSVDVQITRQLILVRQGNSQGPLRLELFNERGEVLRTMEWNGSGVTHKAVDLDGLSTGRYAMRISGAGRSEVVRFRQD